MGMSDTILLFQFRPLET